MIAGLPRQLLFRVTLFRFCWCAARYVWFALILRRLKTTPGAGVAASTLAHNIRGMFDLAVERSNRLIYPLVSIQSIRENIGDTTLLTIGPRTEGEIFNLIGLGFEKRNLSALDLISYSPLVDLGDMHAMPYPDAAFDVVMLGWVISYSDDKAGAAQEILRVTRPGGIVAVGIEWHRQTPEELAAESDGYVIGSAERLPSVEAILALFGGRVDRVYFRQDDQDLGGEGGDLLVVFRLT